MLKKNNCCTSNLKLRVSNKLFLSFIKVELSLQVYVGGIKETMF
jgi:hypothetical protein